MKSQKGHAHQRFDEGEMRARTVRVIAARQLGFGSRAKDVPRRRRSRQEVKRLGVPRERIAGVLALFHAFAANTYVGELAAMSMLQRLLDGEASPGH
jgi:hypothetical protein